MHQLTNINQLAMNFVQTRYRKTDNDTSKTAAKHAVSGKADSERQAIIAAVKSALAGLTGRQVAVVKGIDYIECQRRLSECGLTKTKTIRDGCRVWVAA